MRVLVVSLIMVHDVPFKPNFPGTEPPLDLTPVCKLEFVRCGAVEKN